MIGAKENNYENESRDFGIGDMVVVPSGQKTDFFEIIKIENEKLWLTNGWVQITRASNEVELICRAKERKDKKVPRTAYINTNL